MGCGWAGQMDGSDLLAASAITSTPWAYFGHIHIHSIRHWSYSKLGNLQPLRMPPGIFTGKMPADRLTRPELGRSTFVDCGAPSTSRKILLHSRKELEILLYLNLIEVNAY